MHNFNIEQLALVQRCLQRCESLVANHFRILALPSGLYPYEVATLTDLAAAERAEGALAHLVVYERQRSRALEHLYRICLIDDVILKRSSGQPGINLGSLLSYILTHELVHVVRFQRQEHPFSAGWELRQEEEERVHQITLDLLRGGRTRGWAQLDELFCNPSQARGYLPHSFQPLE